jgi:NADH dehydrogenase (ubiquinone) 1 beta subcomplex subunit 7
MSLGLEKYQTPETYPKSAYPNTFDPLTGFPKGRKKREMKVTEEEMDAWGLETEERDYCAHKFIAWRRCMMQHTPVANWYCDQIRHDFDHCELEDTIMRMKEFERERRLLKRMKRKRERQAAGEGNQVANQE